MIVVGAKGFAKEVLEIIYQNKLLENLTFYDDVSHDIGERVLDEFPIIKKIQEVEIYFQNIDSRYTIGIGNPELRNNFYLKFNSIGGVFTSTISPGSIIGTYNLEIGVGCNILPGAIISNGASIGKGCIIYYNAMVTHDCIIGEFVELSPGATILGRAEIGRMTQIGANATILPKIKIGENVIIGAGAVVNRNLPDNCVAVGVPAKIIKFN